MGGNTPEQHAKTQGAEKGPDSVEGVPATKETPSERSIHIQCGIEKLVIGGQDDYECERNDCPEKSSAKSHPAIPESPRPCQAEQ